MSFEDPVFWVGQLITVLATAAGVLLAFTLERVADQRRQDAAAFWAAKHWARAVLRTRENGLLITGIRALVYGRSAQKRPEVQMLLTEVDPGVAEWWSRPPNASSNRTTHGYPDPASARPRRHGWKPSRSKSTVRPDLGRIGVRDSNGYEIRCHTHRS